MIHRRLHPLMMIVMLLAGCAVGPDYQPPARRTRPVRWNALGDGRPRGEASKTASVRDQPRAGGKPSVRRSSTA